MTIVPAVCGVVGLCLAPFWRRVVSLHTTALASRRGALVFSLALTTLAVGVGWRFGATLELAVWLWAGMYSLVLAIIDLRVHKLPQVPLAAMAAGGISGFTTLSVLAHDWAALRRALLAGAGVWLVMRIVERACRGGMGGGDTRLHTVLALYTGWISWHTFGVGIFAGTLLLGATAAITCLCGHGTGSDRIAAGPSLLAGAWIAILLSA